MPKYIDADAAAEFVKKLAKPGDADFPTWILSMLEVLEIRPAANVRENKQSKWRCVDSSDNVYACDGRDGCGGEMQITEGTPKENGMDFCPFCGAEMEEDEE